MAAHQVSAEPVREPQRLLEVDLARRIETELEYPGQSKVTVIRETRAIEYAK